jgi:hypothetical protein
MQDPNLMATRLQLRALERRVVRLESALNSPNEGNVMTHEQADWIVDTLSFEHEEGDTSKAWSESHKLWMAKHLVNASEAYWFGATL